MAKKVKASHILVKTESEANVVYFDVTHGKSFEEVAREKSICPSRKHGGDLGWFGRGQMVREFENAAFSMERGQISKPVKSRFGWHIVKLVDAQ
ncbi:MAG: peptidyl-prolyl cis-trans isomerase C [archaeon GW2011_AR3]|nr:MAG: peptidyl-prolyl cis-trans isomerase C [archaeon GW2011_AR3]MBS3109476.1 peptidyl-prolyl cis-trans isomerase [Candidatus Woesearchaeota archaeon]